MKKYKRKTCIYVLTLQFLFLTAMMWLIFLIIPNAYYQHTGRNMFPAEPEQIIEPAVMSTRMINLAKESEQAYTEVECGGMYAHQCKWGIASETGKIIRENVINYEY